MDTVLANWLEQEIKAKTDAIKAEADAKVAEADAKVAAADAKSKEKDERVARYLLRKGETDDEISDVTGMDIQSVRRLRASLSA